MTTPYDPYGSATSALPGATASQIPGGILGLSSVTVNTSEINFSSNANGGMFGYSGQPGSGNLYFAFAPVGGTDNYGNTYQPGINVLAGQLQGVSIIGAAIDSATVLNGSSLQGPQILTPTVTGGTAASLVHTMTNSNGQVLGYTILSTAVTFATNGFYQWTCPTGVTTIRVQCWGAGGGGGGGGGTAVQGGESGGGGEYAEEPSYGVIPGQVYFISVGAGGQGGSTGFTGSPGSSTSFAPFLSNGLQVIANPGVAGANFQGGSGGSGSNNTIHFNGGNGASADGNTGGGGGGGSGGPTSQGNPGLQATSSAGAGGGTAVPGGGPGGAGGNVGVSGVNGAGPGGGGGGGGYEAFAGSSNTYQPSHGTYSYYGSDAGSSFNDLRNHDGPMFQGQDGTSNFAGHQYSYMTLPYQQIQSDLASVVITSVAIKLHNLHSYYSSGMYVNMRYSTAATFGTFGDGGVGVNVSNFHIKQGATITQNVGLGGSIGIALQNGNAKSILFGPTNTAQGNNYYGYFDSGANNGVVPELIVYYGGSVNAGNGADGKVILTYSSGTVPTYQLSVSAIGTTDVFGNTVPTGFAGPQLTLTNQTNASPSTSSTSSVIVANTAGTPTVTNSQGNSGQLPLVQVDTTPFTVTGVAFAGLTKAWNVPVNDAQVNTCYRLTAHGNGTWGNPAEALFLDLVTFGVTVCSFSVGTLVFNTAASFGWSATGLVMFPNVGVSGTIRSSLTVTMSAFGQLLFPGGGTQATGSFLGQNNNTSVNTTNAGTIQIQSKWSANGATLPTISSFGSMMERLGT